MCAEYGQRPSAVVGIDPDENNWLAYEFDVAVFTYGRYVNNKLKEADDKGRPKHTLKEILADEHEFVSLTEIFLAGGETRAMAF